MILFIYPNESISSCGYDNKHDEVECEVEMRYWQKSEMDYSTRSRLINRPA